MSENKSIDQADAVRKLVREGYSKIAVTTDAGCYNTGVSCCGSTRADAEKLAKQIGYSAEELAALPEGANMGLSCGNPAALAALKPGETVLDLGAGAVQVEETGQMAKAAGLVDIVLTPKPDYVNALTDWEDPLYKKIINQLPAGTKPADFITSFEVKAHKP